MEEDNGRFEDDQMRVTENLGVKGVPLSQQTSLLDSDADQRHNGPRASHTVGIVIHKPRWPFVTTTGVSVKQRVVRRWLLFELCPAAPSPRVKSEDLCPRVPPLSVPDLNTALRDGRRPPGTCGRLLARFITRSSRDVH